MRTSEADLTGEFMSSLEYYDITRPIARKAGRLKRELARKGKTISLADVTIAAVAMVNRLASLPRKCKTLSDAGTGNLSTTEVKRSTLHPCNSKTYAAYPTH